MFFFVRTVAAELLCVSFEALRLCECVQISHVCGVGSFRGTSRLSFSLLGEGIR